MHINNLYRDQRILLFRECFALEKVHGTSAHVSWKDGEVQLFSGGEPMLKFAKLFDKEELKVKFLKVVGDMPCTVFGEAYGGSQQGMRHTYGDQLRFIVFDVKMGEHTWLAVPDMDQVARDLGFEVVPWEKVSTDVAVLDAIRDRPSEVAQRRGCGADKPREGVVLRPPVEVRLNNGERVIAKHKGAAFEERARPPKVDDPSKLQVLTEANAIAAEWVTEMRLTHVLDKLLASGEQLDIRDTPKVISAMVEDVEREAADEIVASKEARAAVGRRAAQLFKARLQAVVRVGQ